MDDYVMDDGDPVWQDEEREEFLNALEDIMNTEPPGPKDHRTWTHRTQHKQANWEVLLPSLVAAYIKWKHPESTQAAPPESVPSTSRESTPTPSLESAPATPPSDAASAPDTPVLDLPPSSLTPRCLPLA
ncbi:hypothetical protein CONPUDRAFT_159979 [Coniophora puteana RWD-64-598 SS2]|uniref:Uncharacterized protein n=1 Tax=Coniophora puteana (strain RWD-64-598) TaxID=741705 RepID=R7SG38_CONPW|nr:uncharacterized protein CONPUDRAFT_159979 [Coniophora puteana RWD-64-598 SS2]EIW74687.1 hypothetical protein CONPUDRAFT_159979 [Coniophora puteana RWD-64-598 SS2]